MSVCLVWFGLVRPFVSVCSLGVCLSAGWVGVWTVLQLEVSLSVSLGARLVHKHLAPHRWVMLKECLGMIHTHTLGYILTHSL